MYKKSLPFYSCYGNLIGNIVRNHSTVIILYILYIIVYIILLSCNTNDKLSYFQFRQ